ncbi:hypothetical protein [Mycolicibacterium sp. P1-5]|uniref:hypothetical protein n=1 Tax=Mycolicibacterium sp. P1-5 TaxID=2024617 RepID=UPI0011F0636E|nr:hypothetical protein [Mycolicibacterium sp. P1-5]
MLIDAVVMIEPPGCRTCDTSAENTSVSQDPGIRDAWVPTAAVRADRMCEGRYVITTTSTYRLANIGNIGADQNAAALAVCLFRTAKTTASEVRTASKMAPETAQKRTGAVATMIAAPASQAR